MHPLQPRELYPGFRKVFGYLLTSSGKGTLVRPLHTRAKSRDHEIVRAQKKVSKGHPNTIYENFTKSATFIAEYIIYL